MAQVQWQPMSRLVEEGACNTKENKVKWGLEGGGAWQSKYPSGGKQSWNGGGGGDGRWKVMLGTRVRWE